jgi:chondroitinase B-like protein
MILDGMTMRVAGRIGLILTLALAATAQCGRGTAPRRPTPTGTGSAPDSGVGGGPAPGEGPPPAGADAAAPDAAALQGPDAASPEGPRPPPADAAGEPATPACVRKVSADSAAALTAALADAKPGDCIAVADGQYPGATLGAKGTAAAPIVLTAVNRLAASFTSGVTMSGAAWVTIEGFGLSGVKITDSQHCRVSRCAVKVGSGGMVVNGTSDATRIDHCDIGGGDTPTDVMNPGGFSTSTLIDHNHFHDLHAPHTITLGCCGPTYDYHDTGDVAEYNLFANCMSGAELFSVKSSSSTIRYNTVRMSQGDIDIRAGRNDSIYGNYVFNGALTFGIRMYEDGHRIYNNYVESGRTISVGPGHMGHAQVKNATIVFNTFVGPVRFGDDVSTVFSNNIVVGPVANIAGLSGTAPITPTYNDNIVLPGPGPAMGFQTIDPQLVRKGEVLAITPASPAVGAATTSFPFVTDDIQGTPRVAKQDLGSQQLSATAGPRRPLTAADVGPDAP